MGEKQPMGITVKSHLQFAFPLMRRRLTNNSCFGITIFLLYFLNVRSRRKEMIMIRDCVKYLVFEIRGGATRLKECLRVSQDDTFSSSINHILEEGLQVFIPFTIHLLCNVDIFAWMFLHVFNYEIKR